MTASIPPCFSENHSRYLRLLWCDHCNRRNQKFPLFLAQNLEFLLTKISEIGAWVHLRRFGSFPSLWNILTLFVLGGKGLGSPLIPNVEVKLEIPTAKLNAWSSIYSRSVDIQDFISPSAPPTLVAEAASGENAAWHLFRDHFGKYFWDGGKSTRLAIVQALKRSTRIVLSTSRFIILVLIEAFGNSFETMWYKCNNNVSPFQLLATMEFLKIVMFILLVKMSGNSGCLPLDWEQSGQKNWRISKFGKKFFKKLFPTPLTTTERGQTFSESFEARFWNFEIWEKLSQGLLETSFKQFLFLMISEFVMMFWY